MLHFVVMADTEAGSVERKRKELKEEQKGKCWNSKWFGHGWKNKSTLGGHSTDERIVGFDSWTGPIIGKVDNLNFLKQITITEQQIC